MPATGPTIGGRCSVCHHPQLLAIDDLLRAGRPYRRIAMQFAPLGEKAIGRHAQGHVVFRDGPRGPQTTHTGRSGRNEPPASPGASDDPTVDPADVLRRQLAYLDGLDLDALSPAQRVDLLEARRRTADSLSKIEPAEPTGAVKVADVEGLADLLHRMHEGLKPWPEAREAMAAIWREYRVETAKEAK
ncbi:MAG TPA: hypothetical protein VNL94_06770 [Candidatus Binatia bacterium]|nr:hypothetical protein [Candidatus Binatia bacterium]